MSERYVPAGAETAEFTPRNINWSRTYGHNRLFLQAQQNYANVMLANKGFLTLNEVYAMLGLDATESGALTGWVGDVVVDFGEEADMTPIDKDSITLHFNVNSNNVFRDKK